VSKRGYIASLLILSGLLILAVLLSLGVGAVALPPGRVLVGLIAPHIARLLFGANHARLIPISALLGALLLLLADDLARTALAPVERRLALAPQSNSDTWPLTVEQVVALGRAPHRGWFLPFSTKDREVVQQAMRACVVQFIKHERGNWGEIKAARQLGIEWHQMGDGFTWLSKDMEETVAKAHHAWALAQEKIASGGYDLIILDEFTYPLKFGWLDVTQVTTWLQEHKPPMLHLIITGRDAPSELVAFADLVTEMLKIKHPFDENIQAQPGIEF
jgi:cob(I)alamin adenosyltransferase